MNLREGKGLQILFDYVTKMLQKSGNRYDLMKKYKEEFISAYDKAQNYLSEKQIQDLLQVSEQIVFNTKILGRCKKSISQKCIKLMPNQLCLHEQLLIKFFLEDEEFKHLPINCRWAIAQRDGLMVSLGTFYRYAAKILGKSIEKRNRISEKSKSIKAITPFQILHMDSTLIRCFNSERVYIHFIMDNYSRKILGAAVSNSSKSNVVAKNIEKVIKEYELQNKEIQLYCDDGPENKKDVNKLLKNSDFKVKKVIANYKEGTTNNMIEAWNKKFKRIVFPKFKIKSKKDLIKKLPKMIEYYNNSPSPVLRTLTPNEAVTGCTLEQLLLKEKMNQAKQNRLEINRNISCNLKEMIDFKDFDCNIIYA
ncbi:DDE-type integrase/transposase/recombinase [Capnocytophaga canis]|uniref:DDE-type integrase/transposase/recombinase n=1 Tax=Capnocytophaga canis TaxID=1848903 RepID=UPI0015620BC0|nr:DDE-type integrase/transposase/recombinase [Capnocytophaga canis]